MRVYFVSCTPSALKLNGLYIGTIDGFERHIELNPSEKIFAEVLPHDNSQPVNFVLDEKFFKNPPPFVDVYLLEEDALINIRNFDGRDLKLEVIYQHRFNNNLITIFYQGKIYLTIEGEKYEIKTLPNAFFEVCGEVKKINGYEVFALYTKDFLVLISCKGEVVFFNRVDYFEFGETLKVVCPFETCAQAKAECCYRYNGKCLELFSSKTIEEFEPPKNIRHFAFFESVLTCGDFEKYLSAELKQKSAALKSFLGDFVSVVIPPEKFYLDHGDIPAVGLVYPQSKNLFQVKYYAVTFCDDGIDNIYPV